MQSISSCSFLQNRFDRLRPSKSIRASVQVKNLFFFIYAILAMSGQFFSSLIHERHFVHVSVGHVLPHRCEFVMKNSGHSKILNILQLCIQDKFRSIRNRIRRWGKKLNFHKNACCRKLFKFWSKNLFLRSKLINEDKSYFWGQNLVWRSKFSLKVKIN